MIRGTGPNSAPASERNVPGLDERDARAPAEIGAPVDRVVDRHVV